MCKGLAILIDDNKILAVEKNSSHSDIPGNNDDMLKINCTLGANATLVFTADWDGADSEKKRLLSEAFLQPDGSLLDSYAARLMQWGSENILLIYRSFLIGKCLQDANLQDANLQDANLQDANLWKANLQDANLQDANLWKANLWKANLQDANLWKANLQDADLQDANLWKANLQDADLQDANLQGAKLGTIGGDSLCSDWPGRMTILDLIAYVAWITSDAKPEDGK